MKSLIIAATLPVMLAASAASASPFQLVNDPSGAPMCADAEGVLAPLSSCAALLDERTQLPGPFASRTDPSGAPMCFAANGEVAPLDSCASAAVVAPAALGFRLETDPSGAAMCFAANGEQAPLGSCQPHQLVGLWSGLAVFAP